MKLEGPIFVVKGSASVSRDFVSSGPMGDGESLGCLNTLMIVYQLKVRGIIRRPLLTSCHFPLIYTLVVSSCVLGVASFKVSNTSPSHSLLR